MNKLDYDYQALLEDILTNGTKKNDRTGTGTIAVFGRTLRHDMRSGFPLLTTKKMYTKGIFAELLWFLRGDTNIQWLVNNNCNIWNGDAYRNYCSFTKENSDKWNKWMRDNGDSTFSMYTMKEFVEKVKTDDEFARKWGELGPIYGSQWRGRYHVSTEKKNHQQSSDYNVVNSIDQIEKIIDDLKTNPDSRRMIVNAWNVAEIESMVLPPCHYGFQVITREIPTDERLVILKNRMRETYEADVENLAPLEGVFSEEFQIFNVPKRYISLLWTQRSVDTFLGLPFNIASYGALLTILGKIVNMVPEELIAQMGDTHLYLDHLEQVQEQIKRVPYELPKMEIPELDTIMESFDNSPSWFDNVVNSLKVENFQLKDYTSHPTIKAHLSN